MATRAQIGIYKGVNDKLDNPESMIFKMHDGYIENTLPVLLRFVEEMDLMDEYAKLRLVGNYEAVDSWLKYFLINDFLKEIKKYVEEDPEMKHLFILKEIYSTNEFYQDIEFYYAFYPDRIECYEVGYIGVADQVFHLVNTVNFQYELLENIMEV